MHMLDFTAPGHPAETALRITLDAARVIDTSCDLRDIADHIVDVGRTLTGFEHACVWLVDDEEAEPVTFHDHASHDQASPSGAVLETLATGDPAAVASTGGGWTELAVPLRAGLRVVGALTLWGDARALDAVAIEALQVVALHAGNVVDAVSVLRYA